MDWVDVFSRKVYRDILIESLGYCRREKGLKLWAYVIMTNHMHCILSATNENLSAVIRDFKRFTATNIMKTILLPRESREDWMMKRFEFAARKNIRSSDHQFWMYDNHPVELSNLKFINEKLDYIHLNPVKAGWIEKPEDWLYSSCRNYCNLPFILEVDILDIPYY